MAAPTVCLCMIVKDEAAVIARCLASVRPVIQSWVVVDTGSVDGTQDVVRDALRGLPGLLAERPWVDFAHNRTEALRLARDRADYTLVIDADDTLAVGNADAFQQLSADCYAIEIHDGGSRYRRPQLVANRLAWRYEGVLHEYLTAEGDPGQAVLAGVVMHRQHDGARRKDKAVFQRDAALLEAALAGPVSDALRARYTFYLAQSHWDAGDSARALDAYLRRADLGGWAEERFVSLHRAAQIMAATERPVAEVLAVFSRASALCPDRAEALHAAARFCRERGMFAEAYGFARRAAALPYPPDSLFGEPWVYGYGALDELAVAAGHTGQEREAAQAAMRLLGGTALPAAERPRVLANGLLALERLGPALLGDEDREPSPCPLP